MRVSWVIATFLFTAPLLGAQSGSSAFQEIKHWDFPAQGGTVTFQFRQHMNNGRPGNTDLVATLAGTKADVTISEQLPMLDAVLKDIPLLGFKVRDITTLTLPMEGEEFKEDANLAVRYSDKWKPCIMKKNCSGVKAILDQFLTGYDRFHDLENKLGSFGLKRVRITMEETSCMADAVSVARNGSISPTDVSCTGKVVFQLITTEK